MLAVAETWCFLHMELWCRGIIFSFTDLQSVRESNSLFGPLVECLGAECCSLLRVPQTKARALQESCSNKGVKQNASLIAKLHSLLLGSICIAESVLDKLLSLLLKPRDADDVSHARHNNVKFVALTFFFVCNKEISNTGIKCWLEMLFCKIHLFVYNSVGHYFVYVWNSNFYCVLRVWYRIFLLDLSQILPYLFKGANKLSLLKASVSWVIFMR